RDVDDHEIRQTGREGGHGLCAVAVGAHGVALACEGGSVVVSNGGFVFDDGYQALHAIQATAWRGRVKARSARISHASPVRAVFDRAWLPRTCRSPCPLHGAHATAVVRHTPRPPPRRPRRSSPAIFRHNSWVPRHFGAPSPWGRLARILPCTRSTGDLS